MHVYLIKYSPKIYQNIWATFVTKSLTKKMHVYLIKYSPKINQNILATFVTKSLTKKIKNRPIWSHCWLPQLSGLWDVCCTRWLHCNRRSTVTRWICTRCARRLSSVTTPRSRQTDTLKSSEIWWVFWIWQENIIKMSKIICNQPVKNHQMSIKVAQNWFQQ